MVTKISVACLHLLAAAVALAQVPAENNRFATRGPGLVKPWWDELRTDLESKLRDNPQKNDILNGFDLAVSKSAMTVDIAPDDSPKAKRIKQLFAKYNTLFEKNHRQQVLLNQRIVNEKLNGPKSVLESDEKKLQKLQDEDEPMHSQRIKDLLAILGVKERAAEHR